MVSYMDADLNFTFSSNAPPETLSLIPSNIAPLPTVKKPQETRKKACQNSELKIEILEW